MKDQQIIISKSSMLVKYGDKSIHIPNRRFYVLYFLTLHKGSVVHRQRLVSSVFPSAKMSTRTIDAHVSRLRKDLDLDIRNVKDVGYVLEENNNIKIEESENKNSQKAVDQEEEIIINGTYVDSKGNQVVVQNIAESTYGRLVVFAAKGECAAISVKDFKSTFKPYGQ